jgi:starch synthase
MFGRLEYYKGLDVLVRAAEMAAKEITGLKVIVAGAGPVAESCRALVTRPELFDWRVGFVPDNDIPDLFALCSVVVLPYRAASQSGVIPLAFANGRSVIATETGSLAEALHDGEDGLLVPPEDPESLARAIVRFHLEPGLAQRLTIQAVETVTSGRLSAAAVASRHLAAYQAMLEGPKGCST